MHIKAQGLLNAATWIENQFGHGRLEQVLSACNPGIRERCATAIAMNWHPVEELLEFLEVAERQLGTGDGRLAEAIGEAGARANTKGALVRMAFWIAKPDFLMKRVAGLWRQFNDEGEMRVLHVRRDVRHLEVTGLSRPHWLFCCTITGWARVTTEAAGIAGSIARHVECRARGSSRCIWEVTAPTTAIMPDLSPLEKAQKG